MLLLATVGWGFGFTWAKTAQEAVNRALELPPEAALGPLFTLGARYAVAGVLMLAVVGRARRGWSRAGAGRAVALGGLLGAALGVQHLGLGRTSEAVSAFLTSLTVVFVPLLVTVGMRRPPARSLWLAVALATVGIWLMTGATPTGFGVGEALGVACAVLFSFHLVAINVLVSRDDPWRMAAGQFLVSGALLLACLVIAGGAHALSPRVAQALLSERAIWLNLLLSLLFPTLLSFSLMSVYQPRLDPVRVALIYLMEPIFAAIYAFAARGRAPALVGMAGAALILGANLLVELRRGSGRPPAGRQGP